MSSLPTVAQSRAQAAKATCTSCVAYLTTFKKNNHTWQTQHVPHVLACKNITKSEEEEKKEETEESGEGDEGDEADEREKIHPVDKENAVQAIVEMLCQHQHNSFAITDGFMFRRGQPLLEKSNKMFVLRSLESLVWFCF